MSLTGENLRRLIELAGGAVAGPDVAVVPPSGDRGPRRHLTVAVTTAGDIEGTYLTLAGLRLGGLDQVGLLVLDTAPRGPDAWALKALEWEVPGLRYVPAGDLRSRAAAWDRAFEEANAAWVLCLESPVVLAPGAVAALLAFTEAHPDLPDLLHGPRLAAGVIEVTTHLAPEWEAGVFGVPACDSRGLDPEAPPFEIPMQSLAVLACRRDAWVGGNPSFQGPAGAEGYVHEKVRKAGGRNLCLPFLRWAKRSVDGRAAAASGWEDHVRNHLIGWEEVGLPLDPLFAHLEAVLGHEAVSIARSRWASEKANPLRAFDGIFCINLDSRPDRWERMLQRFQHLGIAHRVRRVPGVETPLNNHVGCALAHRSILETAGREGLRQVLVFEDDAVFLEGATWVLRRSLAELARQDWKLLYLGSFASPSFPLADGCHHLEVVHGMIGLHAFAYHERVFDELLAQIPSDVATMSDWVVQHPIDLFLANYLSEGVYRVSPMVASQENLIPEMADDLRDQFLVAQ